MLPEKVKKPLRIPIAWKKDEAQHVRTLLQRLNDFSLLRFFTQIFGVMALGTIAEYFEALPWLSTAVNVNTITMTLAFLGVQWGLRSQLRSTVDKKSFLECLWLESCALPKKYESLATLKLARLYGQCASWDDFLNALELELSHLPATNLPDYQKKNLLRSLYEQLKELNSQRSYLSYFYRLITRKPMTGLSSAHMKLLWNQALSCGDTTLLLDIAEQLKNDTLKFGANQSEKTERQKLIESIKKSSTKKLQRLFGHETTSQLQESLKAQAPTNNSSGPFPILSFFAKMSQIMGVWLIEPLAKVNNNVQRNLYAYQQAGLIAFSSTIYITLPLTLFLGAIGIIYLFRQIVDQSMRFVARSHNIKDITQAYAQNPQEHYRKLLSMKIRSMLYPSKFSGSLSDLSFLGNYKVYGKGEDNTIPLDELSEQQCFIVYQMLMKHYRSHDDHVESDPTRLRLTAALPFIQRLNSLAQRKQYYEQLRPIGLQQKQMLLAHLNEKITEFKKSQEVMKAQLTSTAQSSDSSEMALQQQYAEALQFHERQEKHLRQISREIQAVPCMGMSGQGCDVEVSESNAQEKRYNKLCRLRQFRQNMLSYVFPFSTITGSVMTMVFYFIPISIAAAALIYTVIPAALLLVAALGVGVSYLYIKHQEKVLLSQLSLADFWGQKTQELHTEVFLAKIQSLSTESEEVVKLQLSQLADLIETQNMLPCDVALLAKVLPELKKIAEQFESCQSSVEKISQRWQKYHQADRSTAQMLKHDRAIQESEKLAQNWARYAHKTPQFRAARIKYEIRKWGALLQKSPESALHQQRAAMRSFVRMVRHQCPKTRGETQSLRLEAQQLYKKWRRACHKYQASVDAALEVNRVGGNMLMLSQRKHPENQLNKTPQKTASKN